jgi:hypothetical protein
MELKEAGVLIFLFSRLHKRRKNEVLGTPNLKRPINKRYSLHIEQ